MEDTVLRCVVFCFVSKKLGDRKEAYFKRLESIGLIYWPELVQGELYLFCYIQIFVQPVLENLQRSWFHMAVFAVVGLSQYLTEFTSAAIRQLLLATPGENRADDRAIRVLHATFVHGGRLLLWPFFLLHSPSDTRNPYFASIIL